MGQFLSTLKTEQVRQGTLSTSAKYRLTSPLIYESNTLNQIIIVPAGFITDFATVPRLPFIYSLLGNLGHAAATLHDFLYTEPHLAFKGSNKYVNRKLADKILQGAIVDGMIADIDKDAIATITQSFKTISYIAIGFLFYIGVRIGGASHWERTK